MPKEAILLYIEPNRCYFQSAALPSALQFDIPWEVAHDGDIADKEKFTSLLQTFLQTNSIENFTVGIILSPEMTFEKDISGIELPEQTAAAEAFINSIPFENVSTLPISVEKTKIVIATNKDIIDTYRNILSTQNCQVSVVGAVTIFQQLLPQLQETLDLQAMLEKLDLMRQYSFLTPQETQPQNRGQEQKQKQNPLRLAILAGVFTVLIAILGILIFQNSLPHK